MITNPGQRELVTISSARRGHCRDNDGKPDTIWVQVDSGGCGQGFGGLYLKTYHHLELYETMLTDAFGVPSLKHLKGERCYALRHYGTWNDYIVGLESVVTARKFTHYDFQRKIGMKVEPGLAGETKNLKQDIARAEARVVELKQELETVKSRYHDWR